MKRIELYENKGFVELINTNTESDRHIANIARTCYQSHNNSDEIKDKKLIERLIKDRHTSPIEFIQLQFRVKVPLYIKSQIQRHRTMSYNETSLRYTPAEDCFYYPKLRMQSKTNKQSSIEYEFDESVDKLYNEAQEKLKEVYNIYNKLLDKGCAREICRSLLPTSLMTTFVLSVNLHNLMHFLQLRCANDAQKEIRDVANAMYEITKELYPISMEAFEKYIKWDNQIIIYKDEIDKKVELSEEKKKILQKLL